MDKWTRAKIVASIDSGFSVSAGKPRQPSSRQSSPSRSPTRVDSPAVSAPRSVIVKKIIPVRSTIAPAAPAVLSPDSSQPSKSVSFSTSPTHDASLLKEIKRLDSLHRRQQSEIVALKKSLSSSNNASLPKAETVPNTFSRDSSKVMTARSKRADFERSLSDIGSLDKSLSRQVQSLLRDKLEERRLSLPQAKKSPPKNATLKRNSTTNARAPKKTTDHGTEDLSKPIIRGRNTRLGAKLIFESVIDKLDDMISSERAIFKRLDGVERSVREEAKLSSQPRPTRNIDVKPAHVKPKNGVKKTAPLTRTTKNEVAKVVEAAPAELPPTKKSMPKKTPTLDGMIRDVATQDLDTFLGNYGTFLLDQYSKDFEQAMDEIAGGLVDAEFKT